MKSVFSTGSAQRRLGWRSVDTQCGTKGNSRNFDLAKC